MRISEQMHADQEDFAISNTLIATSAARKLVCLSQEAFVKRTQDQLLECSVTGSNLVYSVDGGAVWISTWRLIWRRRRGCNHGRETETNQSLVRYLVLAQYIERRNGCYIPDAQLAGKGRQISVTLAGFPKGTYF